MSNDYDDYEVWKEVDTHDGFHFSELEEYTPEDVKEICDDLIKKAEEEGLQGCYLRFHSNMEPYEDYLSAPSVTVCGYRKYTDHEKAEMARDEKIREMARDMGISEYEAKIIQSLKDRGKI